MLTVYFVRHGESIDNLRSVWAGWEDAPLSNHGMNQARALGTSLSSTRFSSIYASDLLRAHSTALALQSAQSSPLPPLTVSPLLREQHFGVAEGRTWTIAGPPDFEHGVFPVLHGRVDKFPGGESLDDLAERAGKAVRELLAPRLREVARRRLGSAQQGDQVEAEENVAVVSHGLCISELVPALLKFDVRSGAHANEGRYKGLLNTAWTRVQIDFLPGAQVDTSVDGWDQHLPLMVKVTDHNVHTHILHVKRQGGGIGSAAHDPAQRDIRAFFGGAELPTADVEAAERSESNAHDGEV